MKPLLFHCSKAQVLKSLFICFLLILSTVGCGNSVAKDEKAKEDMAHIENGDMNETEFEDIEQPSDTASASDIIESFEQGTDNANESSSKNVLTEQNTATITSKDNNNSKMQSNEKDTHIHTWVEHTQTIQHKEEGHYEIKVMQEAYDEEVYAWRTFCNKCGVDITDLGAEGVAVHSAILCESGYHNDYVVVDTVHHDTVRKQVWVVDKEGYTETITTCTCDCGVTLPHPTS